VHGLQRVLTIVPTAFARAYGCGAEQEGARRAEQFVSWALPNETV